jgi:hypothetical protein
MLDTGLQEHFSQGDMTLSHRFANPVPMRCHAGIEQLLNRLYVALPERCPYDCRSGMTSRVFDS